MTTHTVAPVGSKTGRAIPGNSLRDAILDRVAANENIEPHPSQCRQGETKYVSAFIRSNGTSFAVDKTCGSKQPIWFLDHPSLRWRLDAEGIAYEVYPPERGRNSNLHKLPNFKDGQLLRIYPKTLEEAMKVVA